MLKLGWDLVFTIINLVILFLALRKFLYKPVMGIMEKRQEMIDKQFSSAKEAEEKANALRKQWEDSMSSVKDEQSRIMDETTAKAKAEYNRIIENANAEAGNIIENANRKVEAEKEKAIKDIESQVAGIAMLAAAKIVNEQSQNINNRAIYDEFLASGENKN